MPLNLRMIWVEMFYLMDQSPRRGVLLKKNGESYTVDELAKIMTASIQEVDETTQWVIRENIASVDKRTHALMCRRMVREEKRRKINTKNAKKGGNPALVNNRFIKPNGQSDIRPDIPKPDPDPDPDPELKRITVEDSPPEDGPQPKTQASGRPRDLAMDYFCSKCGEFTGSPYVIETADAVQLSKLRKAFGIEARQMPPDWQIAVENFFASPLSQYSLADLANPKRYSVFKNSALDTFNKPITHRRNGYGHETKQDRNVKAAQELRARLDSEDRGGDECGTAGSESSGISGTAAKTHA